MGRPKMTRSPRVVDGPPQGGAADPQSLRCDEDALRVEAVEDVAEPLALFADPTRHRDPQPVVPDLARDDGVAAELRDRGDVDRRVLQVDQQQGHALGRTVALLLRGGPDQEEADVAVGGLRRPDLGSGDHVLVAVALGSGLDRRGVGAGVGLGHAERGVERAVGHAGQDLVGELGAAVLANRLHAEDRQVHGRAPVHGRTGGRHLLQHDRGLGDALAAAAELFGDGDPDPAALGHVGVEVPRELVVLVAVTPVGVGVLGADPTHAVADRLVIVVGGEVPWLLPMSAPDRCRARCGSLTPSIAIDATSRSPPDRFRNRANKTCTIGNFSAQRCDPRSDREAVEQTSIRREWREWRVARSDPPKPNPCAGVVTIGCDAGSCFEPRPGRGAKTAKTPSRRLSFRFTDPEGVFQRA